MRELTEEELKLAPDWATHYFIDELDDALYAGLSKDGKYYSVWWFGLSLPIEYVDDIDGYVTISKKPFDITKHEWSDTSVKEVRLFRDGSIDIQSNLVGVEVQISIYKQDAIAIAKALGVTAEDLK